MDNLLTIMSMASRLAVFVPGASHGETVRNSGEVALLLRRQFCAGDPLRTKPNPPCIDQVLVLPSTAYPTLKEPNIAMPSSKALVFAAVPFAVSAYVAWRVANLNKEYPVQRLPSNSELHRFLPSLELAHDEPDYISARVALRPSSLSPIDRLSDSFWSTWTLKVEGYAARATGYQSIDGQLSRGAYVNGIFPVQRRTPTSVIVLWRMPQPLLGLCKRLGVPMVAGGVQELLVTQLEGDEIEIGYACAQHLDKVRAAREEEKKMGTLGLELHRLYMKFLLDSARKRMER